jgi:hypothetical protein
MIIKLKMMIVQVNRYWVWEWQLLPSVAYTGAPDTGAPDTDI